MYGHRGKLEAFLTFADNDLGDHRADYTVAKVEEIVCVTLNWLTIKKIKGSTNLKPNDQKYLCATLNLVTLTVSNQVSMTMAIMTLLPPVQDV